MLIPAFNVEAHVGACLGSILAQMRPGVEVVVIDDASVDATAAIVAAAQRDHPELLLSHHQSVNAGVATTRNRLVRAARGDYLWFIDADDVVAAGAIEALQAIVDCHGPDLVLCDFRPLGRRRTRRRSTFRGPSRTLIRNPADVAAGILEAGNLHPWSKISRRSLWGESLRFPDGRVFEDVAVMPRLALQASTAYHEPEAWIGYRRHPDSIVATMNPRKCVDLVRAVAECPGYVRRLDLSLSDRFWFASRDYAARHFVSAMRHLQGHPDERVLRGAQATCLRLFLQAVEGRVDWLGWHYARRGWLPRLARLRYWIAVAQDAAGFETKDGVADAA